MFTINQIKDAHAKVKSGADFPQYIQDMKALGIISYEHFVTNGQIHYYSLHDFNRSAEAKWEPVEIAAQGDREKLKQALTIHQQGETSYLTFCRQSAEAGVEKWVVDIKKMTCIYYDKAGHKMVTEIISLPVKV